MPPFLLSPFISSGEPVMTTTLKSDSAPALFDALLDIKRLAGKSDDRGYDPFTLLDLIAERALTALSNAQK
jgi:hypothetical protein